MKIKFNRQEILVLVAVMVAMLIHFISVVRQTYVTPLTGRDIDKEVAQAIQFGSLKDTQASSEAFSLLFGVTPVLIEEKKLEKPKQLTLSDLSPKLVAIDEVNGNLTGRMVVDMSMLNKKSSGIATTSRLITVTVGTEVYGYSLIELTNNTALFMPNKQEVEHEQELPQLSLNLFKPQTK
ncbi:hypothetical protein [Rheinheimera sp. MMS21-TC3]|uniref:hypothetical protein n=1 Tax=Rheinheimera sp. MMS21-TC3 TaxID=3072790 RepID=UPI0028C50404|nr:hypothetical protein [Rheinheimera sp. MMS21-TC3]WNO61657.1 hypothetical protein RDV63_12075 [Rheinheimera sp. MMS21-TC3]